MENQRKKQMKLQRKRVRRKVRFFFIFGLLLGSSAVFMFYYGYYSPQLALESEKERQAQAQQITALQTENNELQSKLNQTLADAEKKKPRMTFGQSTTSHSFPELASQIEEKVNKINFVGSILVVKDNQIVLEKGYGYADKTKGKLNDPNTTFLIASVQKAYTAVLIMKLIEDGLLTMETPLATYYPSVQNSEQITIRELLNMTSGLQLKGIDPNGLSEEDTLTYAINNVTYSPLSKWSNSAVNYTLLAGIIRQLTGKDYQDYFTAEITMKLNLQHTGFYPSFYTNANHAVSSENKSAPYAVPYTISNNKFASETGTGNVYSTVGDMFTFFQGLIDEKIIAKDSLKQLWERPTLAFDYNYAAGFYHETNSLYGHGNFVGYEPTLQYSTDGSTGVITLSSYIRPENSAMTKDIFKLIQ